jgi:hypothetical protein
MHLELTNAEIAALSLVINVRLRQIDQLIGQQLRDGSPLAQTWLAERGILVGLANRLGRG